MGTIQRQGLINSVIIYVGVILGFLNRVVVQTHYLSAEEVGLAGLLISFSALLTTFFLLGSSSMCVRYFPVFRNEEKRHHGFLGFMLLLPLSGILVGGLVLWLIKSWLIAHYQTLSPLFTSYFGWTFPLAGLMTISIALNAYSYSLLKTTVPSFINDIWVRILLILIAIFHGLNWISLDQFVIGVELTYLSQMIIMLVYIFSVDRPGILVDWSFVNSVGLKSILSFSFLLTLTALSSLSLKFLDGVFIGAYLGEKQVGIYLIGGFIAQFIETPLNSVERIAGSKIAHAFSSGNMQEICEIYYRSVRLLFALGGFLAVCIITNIYDFLLLIPDEYHNAAAVTIIISVGSIINMATGVNSPILNNSSKYIWGVIFLFILLIISVVLYMLFIPRFGIAGAAIATGLASVVYNLLKFFFIWKNFGLQPYDMRTLKTILIIGTALAAGLFIPVHLKPLLSIIVRGTIISVIYGSMVYWLKILPDYHHLLNRFFPRIK